jgi:hypothetical protein
MEWDSGIPQTFIDFMQKSFDELYSIQGQKNSPLHQLVFQGPSNGITYKKWLAERVQKVVLSSNCNVTAHIDSDGPKGVLYISKCNNLNPEASQRAYWLSIFVHEARHLESKNKFWKHSVCSTDSGDVDACDYSPVGAFGVEKIWSQNILNSCTNCSEDFRNQLKQVYEDQIVWNKIKSEAQDQIHQDLKLQLKN